MIVEAAVVVVAAAFEVAEVEELHAVASAEAEVAEEDLPVAAAVAVEVVVVEGVAAPRLSSSNPIVTKAFSSLVERKMLWLP